MNLALFDFDGTITRDDTFTRFVRFAVRPGRLILGGVLLSPLVVGYRLNWVSASRARPIVARVGFQGERAESVRELGRRYASEVLPGVIRRRAMDRIEWHQRQGDLVVVVSASLDVYLDPWCESVGVQRICTELEERSGRLTGRYCHGDCSGAEKVRRILEQHEPGRYPLIYAYGDTSEDRDMLGLAHRKYYRWKEIGDWGDAAALGRRHPAEGTARRNRDAG
jgi:HAD superfamily hydrolase (TIGR01490 family)